MVNKEEEISTLWTYISVLTFVGKFLISIKPGIQDPFSYANHQERKRRKEEHVKIIRCSDDCFKQYVAFDFDWNGAVVVHPSRAVKWTFHNLQWQLASFYTRKGKKIKRISNRWIKILVSEKIDPCSCFISSVLYFNITKDNEFEEIYVTLDDEYFPYSEWMYKIIKLWTLGSINFPRKDILRPVTQPRYAKVLKVAVIESPYYNAVKEVEQLLHKYFDTTRIVRKEDVLCIPIPISLRHLFISSSQVSLPPKWLFFKVVDIEDANALECLLVSKEQSSLFLVSNTRCLVPSVRSSFTAAGEIYIPLCLKKIYEKSLQIYRTFLCTPYYDTLNVNKDSQTLHGRVSRKPLSDILNRQYKTSEKPKTVVSKQVEEKANKQTTLQDEAQNIASPNLLLIGPAGSGKKTVVEHIAEGLHCHLLFVNAFDLKGETSGNTEGKIRQVFHRAAAFAPCILAMRNIYCLGKDKESHEDARVVATLGEVAEKFGSHHPRVFFFGLAEKKTDLTDDLWSLFIYHEILQPMSVQERQSLLMEKRDAGVFKGNCQIDVLTQRTAGFVLGDFSGLMESAQRKMMERVLEENECNYSSEDECSEMSHNYDVSIDDENLIITENDILKALDELQQSRSEALGAPQIPKVKWEEVGGLEEAKQEIIDTIQLPIKYPNIISETLRRSGVLLYGPPGTGKTLLAKAVATECGLNFMSVKGPELLNMYVGQSEENVREVFSKAKLSAPCIIFFDELDSLAPNRGRSGDSGGVMDRIVSQLLAELDGVSSEADVFVLGATNRPDLIDPALLRPGRFEKMVFLGVCEDKAGQMKIMEAVTSKMPISSNVNLKKVTKSLPLTLTGADFYAFCTDALYAATQRAILAIENGNMTEEDMKLEVEDEDFQVAQRQLLPSVSPEELRRYKLIKESFNT
ncbi:peroxisomal biogenesis factor 6 [Oratosquilla oratoria]|uniref:peroxisomal biogenesis factor 6 n=1 Tax=Oratosquilla oratoria TaxID=337810 RepID=UPI003F75CE7F